MQVFMFSFFFFCLTYISLRCFQLLPKIRWYCFISPSRGKSYPYSKFSNFDNPSTTPTIWVGFNCKTGQSMYIHILLWLVIEGFYWYFECFCCVGECGRVAVRRPSKDSWQSKSLHVPDETNSIKEWSLSNPNGNCSSVSPFSCSFAVTIQVVAYKTR